MKICFPARKANGKDYSTLDDMMAQVGREPHGTWLAGTNGMWHGGIHISRESAPASFLTPENVDTAVPLPFMAGGEVVAYRLNSQYLTDSWLGQTLQYSSTFVLVKSVCTPDPDKPDNSLEFYALYLGLTPPSAFPALQCYQVTAEGNGLRTRHYSGQEKTGEPAPVPTGKLATGQKVVVLRENLFGLDGHIPTFGLARRLNEHDEMTGEAFWVSVDPLYMTPVGKHTAHLPAWMQQAMKQGTYDAVVKPASSMTVAAGDAVGFLGEDIVPGGLHETETDPYVHIEVLSTDDRLPDFLRNAAGVTGGEKYLHIRPESSLYTRSGDTFTRTSGKVRKDIHKILPQAKCPSFTDGAGKRWFDIGQGAWLSGDDVEADISQYDLIRRGFSAFEQPATASMEKSLHENWVKSAFNHLSEWVRPERGIREKQVSNYYQALIRKMDQNHDGELSGEELHQALQYPEMDVRDLVAGLVIKHDSEWSGGSSHLRWTDYLKHMDLLLTGYVRTWLDNMEWMSQVPPFDKGKPVWHMHPVKFLDALKSQKKTLKGKLTYNAEGNDIPSSMYYSRVIHWPGNDLSGVTLGRGYDMGDRSEADVYRDMVASGIPNGQAGKISKGAGLKGNAARDFVRSNKNDIGEITLEQQESLFALIYPKYVERAISNYNKWTNGVSGAKPWVELMPPIQEVLVDFVYQGFTKGPKPMLAGSNNNKQELIDYIRNTNAISQYEPGRHRADYLETSE
ncbi:pesticin C-terminus-like muramidase [Enterobacter sp. JBIWA005]|uniref:pesticin C-terminus-like muramidase n=1 Tax=Enterobacter sp. JBIWA005 TaxID=2831891 RepID=UPI001CC10F59|nr:pesticin C-terminus-like muramidase [Enterobacter sp. JBIWA005]